jgi:hypothetical protein
LLEDNNDVGGDSGREFDTYEETRLVDHGTVVFFAKFMYINKLGKLLFISEKNISIYFMLKSTFIFHCIYYL